MICHNCKKDIDYVAKTELITIGRKEMAWGEYSIYPLETSKVIVCSSSCAIAYIQKELN